MKIIVLIACILALVHADKITGKVYRKYLADCGKKLSLMPGLPTEQNPLAQICALMKAGLFNGNAIDRNKVFSLCESVSSNLDKQEKCKNIVDICLVQVNDTGLLGSTTNIAHTEIVGNIEGKIANLAQKIKFVSCCISHGVMRTVDS